MQKDKLVPMDVLCETATALTEYIWYNTAKENKGWTNTLEFENEAGDLQYVDEAQNIFNSVLDRLDEQLNGGE